MTGASGRLGRALRPVLDNIASFEATYLISPSATQRDVREHSIDIRDAPSLRAICDKVRPEVIVHIASITGARCEENPALAQAINVDAVRTLIDVARDLGTTRLIFASSAAVYGDEADGPSAESAPLRPNSVYAKTKLQAERLLAASEGLETITLRIFNLFGDEFEQSLVWRLLHSSAAHPVTLRGLNNFVRDYVHVDDVVHAIMAAVDARLSNEHETVNIGSGIPTSNASLIEHLSKQRTLHTLLKEGPRSYSCADISHAKGLLGFTPARHF